jgi:hypothetical protein
MATNSIGADGGNNDSFVVFLEVRKRFFAHEGHLETYSTTSAAILCKYIIFRMCPYIFVYPVCPEIRGK